MRRTVGSSTVPTGLVFGNFPVESKPNPNLSRDVIESYLLAQLGITRRTVTEVASVTEEAPVSFTQSVSYRAHANTKVHTSDIRVAGTNLALEKGYTRQKKKHARSPDPA